MLTEDTVSKAATAIRNADAILITAGAGASVDSNLPDFRSSGGIANNLPVLDKLGMSYRQLCDSQLFIDTPELAWGFFGYMHKMFLSQEPHYGYTILRKIFELKNKPAFVYTSNVDGYFLRAGFPSSSIYEIHGSSHFLQCAKKCTNEVWFGNNEDIQIDKDTFRATGNLPACRHCNESARPNILMFSEGGLASERIYSQHNAYRKWSEKTRGLDVIVIEAGAGKELDFVRAEGSEYGGIIRINPEPEQAKKGVIHLQCNALPALTAIAYELGI